MDYYYAGYKLFPSLLRFDFRLVMDYNRDCELFLNRWYLENKEIRYSEIFNRYCIQCFHLYTYNRHS